MATPVFRDFSVVGNITILNSNLAGAATANSALEIDADARSLGSVQITGTWTGTLVLQGTIDGTTWVTVGGTPFVNVNTRAAAANITANGIYQFDASGFMKSRITASAAVTGTAVVTQNLTSFALSTGTVSPVSGTVVLGSGASTIGTVIGGSGTSSAGLSSPVRLLSSAASTNATVVKASAGRLYVVDGLSAAAGTVYLKFFNKASAPVLGTDVPVITKAVKAGQPFSLDFGFIGQSFTTGIAFAITGGVADLDATAVAAGDILGLNVWAA
ncbi:MAG: hypothetical protein IPM11_01190 [Micropruina sp.]|nr:hypothetical protein [Micropruina sp.]